MSRQSTQRSLTLTEELERLEQSITLTLQVSIWPLIETAIACSHIALRSGHRQELQQGPSHRHRQHHSDR